MFTVKIKIKEKNPDMLAAIKKRMAEIGRHKVVAGFPKGRLNNPHYEGEKGKPGPSIIDVAIWNNFGIGVPKRDFMTPATKLWQTYIEQQVASYQDDLVSGAMDIRMFLKTMGEAGAHFISDSIVKLQEPPNAQVTIEGGWITKHGKPIKIKGKKSSNPLYDSGDMSKAPIYEIRSR